MRDATLTLVAMLNAGYREEAQAWRDWLLRAVAGNPADVQIMYGLAGERRLDERELDWLAGFESSTPVRTGNAAHAQLQLDVFGEVADASYANLSHGIEQSVHARSLMSTMLGWLEDNWRQKDSGLWEVRGPRQHFTHSKLMCWVAFDRAVRLHEEFGLPGSVDRWRALRDEIHAEVLANAWSERRESFVQAYGSEELDAAVLLMPLTGFLPPSDPRIVSTVDAIRRDLTTDGLVLRYETKDGAADGLPSGDGAFLACSFWLVSVLELQRRHDEARELFERLLDLRNDVGLLPEEFDPVAGRHLGNFPQAFSHLALVDAALTLSRGRSMHSH